MAASWTLAVARGDLAETTVVAHDAPEPAAGEAVLRVDRVGMTANNVTYGVLGDALRYWEFFPPGAAGLDGTWGLVPLWGFATVTESRVDGVEEGRRLYGYLPPSGHLRVRPEKVDGRGFRDGTEHRRGLPAAYNAYAATAGDLTYRADDEDLLILFRPLFLTSFVLADKLAADGFGGAARLLFSSASSKTAYAAAFALRGAGPALVGLTSPGNVEFTRSLGVYDEVVAYSDVDGLDPVLPTGYVDFSGTAATLEAVRAWFGPRLVLDVAVGLTAQAPDLSEPGRWFFAPDRIRERSAEWGRDGFEQRVAEAWRGFAAAARGWVDVTVHTGPEGLRTAWATTLAGAVPPRTGLVIAL